MVERDFSPVKREYRLLLNHSRVRFGSENGCDLLEIPVFSLLLAKCDCEKIVELIKVDQASTYEFIRKLIGVECDR